MQAERQTAGETWVDLVNHHAPVAVHEALHVGGPDQAHRFENLLAEVGHLVVLEGLTLGRDAAPCLEPPARRRADAPTIAPVASINASQVNSRPSALVCTKGSGTAVSAAAS